MARTDIKRICYILIISGLCTGNLFASSHSSTNYILSMPHIATSGGSADSANYLIKDVSVGSAFGGIAESQNYILNAGCIYDVAKPDFMVVPDEWALPPVKTSSININRNTKIVVRNIGNVPVTFSLRVTDITGKRWDSAESAGLNEYALSAIFTDGAASDVSNSDFGAEDLVTEYFQVSTDEKFAGPSPKNGVFVLPNETRTLWLKFIAPSADTKLSVENRHIPHDICVEIEARKD